MLHFLQLVLLMCSCYKNAGDWLSQTAHTLCNSWFVINNCTYCAISIILFVQIIKYILKILEAHVSHSLRLQKDDVRHHKHCASFWGKLFTKRNWGTYSNHKAPCWCCLLQLPTAFPLANSLLSLRFEISLLFFRKLVLPSSDVCPTWFFF